MKVNLKNKQLHVARVRDVIGIKAYWKYGVWGLAVIMLILAWWWSPRIDFIRPVNMTPTSLSLGILNSRPAKVCGYLVGPTILNIRKQCGESNQASQLIKFTDLKPDSRYSSLVRSGLRFELRTGLLTPAVSLEQPPLPEPAYGTITDVDGNPVPAAVIYVSSSQGADIGLATTTDKTGNYALDLSIFLKDVTQFDIEVIVDKSNRASEIVLRRAVTPFQTIIVNRL